MSPQDLGKVNRYRVLEALVDRGPLSRAELARILGVPRASVGVITNALVDSGILQEDATETSREPSRGKPPRPLWFAESAGLTGALTIESERVSVGVVSARGVVIHDASRPIESTIGHDELLAVVRSMVEEVLLPRSRELVATGLAVPAQVDALTGEVELCTIIPVLTQSPIVREIEAVLGGRVWLEQDVRALAAGERWFGAGRGAESFAVLEIDLGVGVGIVVGGHLFPAAGVSSPQVGHTCVDRQGRDCSCGSVGCWETIASLGWLRSEAAARGIGPGRAILPIDLVALADEGDTEAGALLEEFAENLALGLANLAHIIRTPLVVLQHAIADAGPGFADDIAQRVAARMTSRDPVRIVPTPLRDRALLLGAGATALSHEFGIRL